MSNNKTNAAKPAAPVPNPRATVPAGKADKREEQAAPASMGATVAKNIRRVIDAMPPEELAARLDKWNAEAEASRLAEVAYRVRVDAEANPGEDFGKRIDEERALRRAAVAKSRTAYILPAFVRGQLLGVLQDYARLFKRKGDGPQCEEYAEAGFLLDWIPWGGEMGEQCEGRFEGFARTPSRRRRA